MFIDEFWRTTFPMFTTNYDFIYAILDVLTIISMIRILFELPSKLLNVGGKKWW